MKSLNKKIPLDVEGNYFLNLDCRSHAASYYLTDETVEVKGDVTCAGHLHGQNLRIGGDLVIDGDLVLAGELEVAGNVFSRGHIRAHGGVDVGGKLVSKGVTTAGGISARALYRYSEEEATKF